MDRLPSLSSYSKRPHNSAEPVQTTGLSCWRNWQASCLLLLIIISAISAASFARAETKYASPDLQIYVRDSQSVKGRIVASVNLAAPVEIIEGNQEWTKIRVANGTEGWVRTRSLSNAPLVPTDIFQPGSASDKVVTDAQGAFKKLEDESSRLKQELAACSTDRATLEDKYSTLTSDPDGILHTRNTLEETKTKMTELENKLADAQVENNALKKNQSIMWFLAGSGTLFLGWLSGRLSGSSKKRRQSLV